MLVVKIELHSALTGKTTELGRTIIANDGSCVDATRGNYLVKVARKGTIELADVWNKPLRRGVVKDYPRLSYNVWRLVLRALKSAFPEEV